jgi:hypothetical protein
VLSQFQIPESFFMVGYSLICDREWLQIILSTNHLPNKFDKTIHEAYGIAFERTYV